MNYKFSFNGSGGALFGKMFVGLLLTMITFGIYMPWFYCKLVKWVLQNLELKDGYGKSTRLDFNGQGMELFVMCLIGGLLMMVTFGIYSFWFQVKVTKFYCDNITGTTADGRPISLAFNGTGGELFGKMIVGYILMMITLGIYTPWFICSLTKYYYENTNIMVSGQQALTVHFDGTGAELFGTYLVGAILTCITFGIYFSWFYVNLFKFFTEHIKLQHSGGVHRIKFEGNGGEYFGIVFVGALLSCITFGIYYFWFMVNIIKFHTERVSINQS